MVSVQNKTLTCIGCVCCSLLFFTVNFALRFYFSHQSTHLDKIPYAQRFRLQLSLIIICVSSCSENRISIIKEYKFKTKNEIICKQFVSSFQFFFFRGLAAETRHHQTTGDIYIYRSHAGYATVQTIVTLMPQRGRVERTENVEYYKKTSSSVCPF